MVKVKKVKTEQEFLKCLFIRFMVFFQEQHLDFHQEMNFRDSEATHFLMVLENQPIGTCRYLQQRDYYLLGRLAVLESFRKKGYGTLLIQTAIKHILRKDKNAVIELHAPLEKIDFFKNIGFVPFGTSFLEANAQHIGMRYNVQKK